MPQAACYSGHFMPLGSRYRYQRAPPNQLEMFSEKRSPLNGGSPLPKYAANVRKAAAEVSGCLCTPLLREGSGGIGRQVGCRGLGPYRFIGDHVVMPQLPDNEPRMRRRGDSWYCLHIWPQLWIGKSGENSSSLAILVAFILALKDSPSLFLDAKPSLYHTGRPMEGQYKGLAREIC